MMSTDGRGVKLAVGEAAAEGDSELEEVAGGVPAGVPVVESEVVAATVMGMRDCVPVGEATVADGDDDVVKEPEGVLAGVAAAVTEDDAPEVTEDVAVGVCVAVAVGEASVPVTCSR